MTEYFRVTNTDGKVVYVRASNITTISQTTKGCVIRTVNPNEYVETENTIQHIDKMILAACHNIINIDKDGKMQTL
jgi:hypothetical protein